MTAALFEAYAKDGRKDERLHMTARMRLLVGRVAGFIAVERSQSLIDPDKRVSASFSAEHAAIAWWRTLGGHHGAQAGDRSDVLDDHQLRIAPVMRDDGMLDRAAGPADSRRPHGR